MAIRLLLFDSYPYRTLEPDLKCLVLGARRVDAAVAFVTRPDPIASAGFADNRDGGTR